MPEKKEKLILASMMFVEPESFAQVKTEKDKKPTMNMVAYSGGVIPNHFYWDNLIIDLDGMTIPKGKIPILEDHDTSKKVGFTTKFSKADNQLTVDPDSFSFINTPESNQFQQNSADGFPYQASIRATPTKIQRFGEDEEVTVNGHTVKGPGTVWRKCNLKESSICTFGYDPNTSSSSMSEGSEYTFELMEKEAEVDKSTIKEDTQGMNASEKFKAEHPEEFKALVAEVTTAVETKLTADKGALETKLTEATTKLAEAEAANIKLSAENADNSKRLQALEKRDALREEKDLQFTADAIFTEQFKAAELPDRLHAKVRRLVSHEAFMKDGVLDKEAFKAAIDTELKDWASEETPSSVAGFSASSKSTVTDAAATKLSKSCDEAADRMANYLNPKKA